MVKLLRYLKPFRVPVAVILVLVFLQSLADLYLPTLMSDIVNVGIVKQDTGYIWRTGGWMLLVAAVSGACMVLAAYLSARASMGFGRDLRRAVFTRVESCSLHEFDKIGTASLVTRTTNDITQVQMVLMITLRMMLGAPMMAIGGVIMAVSKDGSLTLVLAVVLPILAGVIFLIARKGVPLFQTMQVKLDRLNLVLREALAGIRVIRAFNRIDHEEKRFTAANRDLTETAIRVNQILAALMPVLMLAMSLTSIAIVWFGAIRVDRGDMLIGDMMAFIQYAMQIMFSLVMVSMMFVMVPRATASAARINEVLAMKSEIRDAPQVRRADDWRGCVEFRDVTFSYPGAEHPAIRNITFSARPGEVTAIIGGTGAGKSTLVNLIARFYDIDSGRILVNGVDVREMAQADLRARIGFVPQQAVLFTGTVADNIRFGKESATQDEVRSAAETAQAMEFVSEREEGFAAEISQGGTNLSGGQKQRLAIARALVRRPEIYIFDDSFSALDFKTDARLRSALRQETRDATVLVVAQRGGTVMDADRILVLDEGRIVAAGTHTELLRTSGVYREIVASQLSEEELA